MLDDRLSADEGPVWLGRRPLAGTGVNALLRSGSGFPFTPTPPYNAVGLATPSVYNPSGPTNSARGPWSFQVDLKVDREMRLGGPAATVYVWVINMTNRRNVSALDRRGTGVQTAVYSSSGSPVSSNWLATNEGREFIQRFGEAGREKFLTKELDPVNFSTPRQVRIGVRVAI
jgi:hypothetical protein